MLEKTIEKYFRIEIEKSGGLCFKFTSPGRKGVPDRIVIKRSGEVIFVELKKEGGRPSALQRKTIEEIRKRGAEVYILEGMSEVKKFLERRIY